MEITFIWLKQYELIECQGFNFGGEYRYEYDYSTETLSVSRNINFIPNFFNTTSLFEENQQDDVSTSRKASLTNVTAIIGKNGAGKSTLLDFIKEEITKGKTTPEAIVIFKSEDSTPFIYCHPSLKIRGIIRREGVEKSYLENSIINEINGTKASFIFFSNIFDNKTERSQNNKLHNISTNFLSRYDKYRVFKERVIHESPNGEIEAHRLAEFYRQLLFISQYSRKKLPFSPLQEVLISPVEIEIKDRNVFGGLGAIVDQCNSRIKYLLQHEDEKNRFLLRAYLAGFTNILFEITQRTFSKLSSGQMKKIIQIASENNIKHNDTMDQTLLKMRNILASLRDYFAQHKDLHKSFSVKFENILGVLIFFEEALKKYKLSASGWELALPGNLKIDKSIKKLIYKYRNSFSISPFLNIRWEGLSSGEKALLNIYSRFYSLIDKGLSSSIIILIDEVELYLHPEWQKRFLYDFIGFISELYNRDENLERREIQLILTSNSPFIASDLPHSNIIFLENIEGKSVVIESLEEKRQTFAANIHSLLSYSFFMKEGLIGEFAKKKINGLIFLLTEIEKEQWLKHIGYIEKLINLIGEPVIRNKLSNILNENRTLQEFTLDHEVDTLKQRVEDLEKVIRTMQEKENDSNSNS